MKKQEELLREKKREYDDEENSWDDKIKTETLKFLKTRKFLYAETESHRFFERCCRC